MRARPSLYASLIASALAALAMPADAACKKFGFTVNDYGKEGPTNDAKNLLDKHISEWAAQNNVKEYQTGKKNVSCELFLDVILFDEHTCTASATVCWGPGVKPNNNVTGAAAGTETAAATEDSGAGHPPSPVQKAHALGIAPQQAAAAAPAAAAVSEMTPTAAATAPAAETPAPVAEAPPTAAAPVAPVEQAAVPDGPPVNLTPQATPTPPATGAALETGALQAGQGLAPTASKKSGPSEKERAAAAAAAASAAAAAERAAQAAETAANAAKEAAAAAVAASTASKGSATVPPLDHASGAKPAHNE